ncbi:hypothetical protein [Haloferula sp. A504]|uniref:hypothetical protein n=1 Tax=Haloferula sp. A504 TaxID=3373601 RepID=UPI0031C9BFEF|nr:hypothetical protein [Verrucomicrobiaceae bacterium E54]
MKLELSPPLESIRRILEGSLRLKPDEPVPSVPAGLLHDLNQRFATQRIVIEPSRQRRWLASLRGLVRTPAFGLAAAALIVFGVLTPIVGHDRGRTNAESFRGVSTPVSAPTMIVLVDSPAGLADTLAHSRSFEADSVVAVTDLASADQIAAPKVVLNFTDATLAAINDQGYVVHTAPLPKSIAELSLLVADALSHL